MGRLGDIWLTMGSTETVALAPPTIVVPPRVLVLTNEVPVPLASLGIKIEVVASLGDGESIVGLPRVVTSLGGDETALRLRASLEGHATRGCLSNFVGDMDFLLTDGVVEVPSRFNAECEAEYDDARRWIPNNSTAAGFFKSSVRTKGEPSLRMDG